MVLEERQTLMLDHLNGCLQCGEEIPIVRRILSDLEKRDPIESRFCRKDCKDEYCQSMERG